MKKSLILSLITMFGISKGQQVNPFNGSLDYSIPLLYLPSDRGNGISIDANYRAGIQVNQPAGEIGLGWSLNTNEAIYRTVSGFPDDTKNFSSFNMVTGQASTGQGALYPYVGSASDYDLIRTSKGPKLDSIDFTSIAFDNFSVGAPAFGGQMKLSYLRFYDYFKFNYGTSTNPDYKFNPAFNGSDPNYRRPQFHFTGDFVDSLVSRHYPAPVTNTTPFNTPGTSITGLGYSSPGSTEPYIGKHQNGTAVSNQNFDITSGRLATSNFVEYFTNKEIDDANTNAFSSNADILTASSNSIIPFIDYKSSHGRSSSTFPPEGIGYFRITASNGLTYHYSLPVYQLETVEYSAPLKNDHSLPACLTAPGFSYGINGPNAPTPAEILPVSGSNVYIKNTTANKYAIKWLLTAITGRDYVDVNNNHMVDDNDLGYWVSYDYQLWSSGFITRIPYYGYDYQYAPDGQTQHYPVYYGPEPVASGADTKLSGLFASVSVSKSEAYYLSKIRTSSHTAVFIMDTRKDEKSGNPSDYFSPGFKPTPSLAVKRILLFNNIDYATIVNARPNTFSQSDYSYGASFSFTSVNSSSEFFTQPWYLAIATTYSNSILKHIAFDQDYSLCRNYHGNIEVSCPGSFPLLSPAAVQTTLNVSNYTQSGKLTLNKIYTYDYQNLKVTPSTVFDYQANNGSYNPEYNPMRIDYWGYYKPDITNRALSRYTTALSKNYTKAWSLFAITDALGGITQVEYESNSYNRVIDVEKGMRGPAFIYRIKEINTLSTTFDVVMEDGEDPNSRVSDFLALCSSTVSGMKKTICMPYTSPTDPTHVSSLANPFFGLAYGESTLAVSTGTNMKDHVTGTMLGGGDAATCLTYPPSRMFGGDLIGNYLTTRKSFTPFYDPLDVSYSGNGFIMFEAPIGFEAYGGGIRVKRINTRNSASEIYTEEYTYEDGVASNEMDRFDYQVLRTQCGGSWPRYDYLRPKTIDMFEMSPSVGYRKVTVKNLGRINTANGKVETEFVSDPTYNNNQFRSYKLGSFVDTDSPRTYMHTINESVNEFSNIFGAVSRKTVYDKNNNITSVTLNEYESTQQGALTENFYFKDAYPVIPVEVVNIVRNIPVVLKSTISYGQGTQRKTETLSRDELTGEGISIRSTGINKSSSQAYKIPAYKYYHALEGLDFTRAESRKMLPLAEDLFSYSSIDTGVVTSQPNGYSSNFLNASYQLYSRKIRQLQYSSSTGTISPADITLNHYIKNRRFQFDGGQGSMDVYGLLKKSALASNTLNLAATTTMSIWEPAGAYNWKLINEITLLDSKRHVLEVRDMNNRFTANKYGYNNYYINASASNCNYASFTFADFEGPVNAIYANGASRFDGDLLATTFTINASIAHTGKRSIGISTSPVEFVTTSIKSNANTLDLGLLPGRIYRASVWVYVTNISNAEMAVSVSGVVNGSTPYSASYAANSGNGLVTTIGNWSLLQADIEIPEGFSTGATGQFKIGLRSNSGTVHFDDFIFRPVESSFSASVFDSRTGRVISNLDANGLSTTYVYDASGKTVEVWREIPHTTSATGVLKKVKTNTYNYARGVSN